MFHEKYLIFQRRFPNGEMFYRAAKPASSKPESQKQPQLTGKATDAERRKAAEKFARSRRETMETAPEIADHILEDIFGHNAHWVKQELGPKYERIIENVRSFLKTGEKYLRSVLIEDRVSIISEFEGHEIDMDLATVLLLSDEEMKPLWPLVTLKREKRAPETKPESFDARAKKVLMGAIMDLMFAFKPDYVPVTVKIEDIYKMPFFKAIRQFLIQSYKAGKPYEVTTTDQGFKLESQDSENFPDREFNIEQVWEEFWSEYAAAENASGEFADVERKLDPTAQLDEQWKGRKAEDMSLEDVETLIFGNTEAGIEGRSIAEIEEIYGKIPNSNEMPIRDALLERANKTYFPDIANGLDDIKTYINNKSMSNKDVEHVQKLANEYLNRIVKECPEFSELDGLVNQYFDNEGNDEMRESIQDKLHSKVSKVSKGTIKEAAALELYRQFIDMFD